MAAPPRSAFLAVALFAAISIVPLASAVTITKYGAFSANKDDSHSSVTCPEGYDAVSCRCDAPCDGVKWTGGERPVSRLCVVAVTVPRSTTLLVASLT